MGTRPLSDNLAQEGDIMFLGFEKKKGFALAAAVGLGVLGSGAWEVVVKPGGQWLGRAVLTGVSLGSTTIRDGVYREAAKGLHEAGSLALLSFTIGFLLAVPFVTLFTLLHFQKRFREISRIVGSGAPEANESPETKLEKRKTKREDLQRQANVLLKWSFLLLIPLFVTIGFVSVTTLQLFIANDTFVYFRQALQVCKPTLTESQAETFQSRFASVRDKNDYVVLIKDLRVVANSHHLLLPDFNPW